LQKGILNTPLKSYITTHYKNNKKVSVCDKLTLLKYIFFLSWDYLTGACCPPGGVVAGAGGVVVAGGTAVGSVGIAFGSTAF